MGNCVAFSADMQSQGEGYLHRTHATRSNLFYQLHLLLISDMALGLWISKCKNSFLKTKIKLKICYTNEKKSSFPFFLPNQADSSARYNHIKMIELAPWKHKTQQIKKKFQREQQGASISTTENVQWTI